LLTDAGCWMLDEKSLKFCITFWVLAGLRGKSYYEL